MSAKEALNKLASGAKHEAYGAQEPEPMGYR